jgi:hypothetical protein
MVLRFPPQQRRVNFVVRIYIYCVSLFLCGEIKKAGCFYPGLLFLFAQIFYPRFFIKAKPPRVSKRIVAGLPDEAR